MTSVLPPLVSLISLVSLGFLSVIAPRFDFLQLILMISQVSSTIGRDYAHFLSLNIKLASYTSVIYRGFYLFEESRSGCFLYSYSIIEYTAITKPKPVIRITDFSEFRSVLFRILQILNRIYCLFPFSLTSVWNWILLT